MVTLIFKGGPNDGLNVKVDDAGLEPDKTVLRRYPAAARGMRHVYQSRRVWKARQAQVTLDYLGLQPTKRNQKKKTRE
jgi:hypothetical protein